MTHDDFEATTAVVAAATAGVAAGASAHADSGRRSRAHVGDAFAVTHLETPSGQRVTVPDPAGDPVHLQLRRFAGCPICNLHLRSIVSRYDEIRSQGIREVVVFHSTAAELTKHEVDLPFPLIADPQRVLYRRLGVERRPTSLLSRRALSAAFGGLAATPRTNSTKRGRLGPIMPAGGRFGLPADFLIATDGRITALKYGRHAYDQWTVDELLDLARSGHS